MVEEDRGVVVAELGQEPGRAFDVGEQEGHRAARQWRRIGALARRHVRFYVIRSADCGGTKGGVSLSYFRLTSWCNALVDTTRLSSKGQLVLPKAIREADAWTEGTEFIVERVPEGVLLRPVRSLPATLLEDVIGCAGYRGPARSAADMERAIAQGVKARRGSGRH